MIKKKFEDLGLIKINKFVQDEEFYKLCENIDKEISAAEEEINNLKINSSEKIKNIAIETSNELIKQLIGEQVNNSSISAIVEEQSKKDKENQYGI